MYRCLPQTKVPIAAGKSWGWSGIYDGLIPGYSGEGCIAGTPESRYSVIVDVTSFNDPLMTRHAAFNIPPGNTFRYAQLDHFTGSNANIESAWANIEINGAVHALHTHQLSIVDNDSIPPGATGIFGLSGDRTWISELISVDEDTFNVSIALVAYYSNGDGTYREIFIHSQSASADASTGLAKINVAGLVRRMIETSNAASFYRFIVLPPGDTNVDIETDDPCDSLRQIYESSDADSGLTGAADTDALGNPLYVWTGTTKAYYWSWDNLSLGTIYMESDAGELAASALLQGDIVPTWPAE